MYDNHTKETWRGWAWNNIALRVQKQKIINPLALCLAGDIAGDLHHANKRKINLIGVDYDIDCVKNFRREGGVAINDNFYNQLLSLQPDISFGDFLGGYTKKTIDDVSLAIKVSNICCFNFMRGRDSEITKYREEMSKLFINTDSYNYILNLKHRGQLVILHLCIRAAYQTIDKYLIDNPRIIVSDYNKFAALKKMTIGLYDRMNPKFYSYRSKDSKKNVFYDSVVFNSNCIEPGYSLEKLKSLSPKKSIQKSAAAKAVLTKKCKTSP